MSEVPRRLPLVSEIFRELQVMEFGSQAKFRTWLKRNNQKLPGFWLKVGKKGNPGPFVTYEEAVEVALCFGWIDGQVYRYDELWYLQRFTPRRPNSPWSLINREKALALIEAGKMEPGGLAAIEVAKGNGWWDKAYAGQAKATVPADFQAALDASPKAAAFFETLSGQNRFAILFRIAQPKTDQGRAKRIANFIAMLERSETVH